MNLRSTVLRRAGLGVVLAATLATSACAAGQSAQTAYEKPTLDGTEADVGHISLRGLAIETPVGTAKYYAAGSNAKVTVVLVNSGTSVDHLTKMSSTAFTSWTAASLHSPTGGPTVAIPSGGAAAFGTPDSSQTLLLQGIKTKIYPGTTVKITFTFAKAGAVSVAVPVQLSSSPGMSTLPGPSATGQEP